MQSLNLYCKLLTLLLLFCAFIPHDGRVNAEEAPGLVVKEATGQRQNYNKHFMERHINLTHPEDEGQVTVAGAIIYYGEKDHFLDYRLVINTTTRPSASWGYCNTFDNSHMIVPDRMDYIDASLFLYANVTRNAPLLDTILGGVPMRCSAFAQGRLRHFYLRYINQTHGGAEYLPPPPDTKVNILDNIHRHANHLVLPLSVIFGLTLIMLVLVPLIMCCVYKCRENMAE